MAAARLPEPGTEFGPCVDDCKHTDCAETRRMVAVFCHFCGEAIGYDRSFCRSAEKSELVHEHCLQQAIMAENICNVCPSECPRRDSDEKYVVVSEGWKSYCDYSHFLKRLEDVNGTSAEGLVQELLSLLPIESDEKCDFKNGYASLDGLLGYTIQEILNLRKLAEQLEKTISTISDELGQVQKRFDELPGSSCSDYSSWWPKEELVHERCPQQAIEED